MTRTPTAFQAKDPFEGDELYQQRARKALPILVRQALAGETIYYSDLAEELEMANPRNLNFVLGSVGRGVENYGVRRGLAVPKLTALVVNKTTGLPGEGVVEFLDRPKEFLAAPPAAKRLILDPADVMGEDYPSETFRVLKNNEESAHGEYRTRRLVLEAWDRLERLTTAADDRSRITR